jgi:hypothetical protein
MFSIHCNSISAEMRYSLWNFLTNENVQAFVRLIQSSKVTQQELTIHLIKA